jgi:hypothetical protein
MYAPKSRFILAHGLHDERPKNKLDIHMIEKHYEITYVHIGLWPMHHTFVFSLCACYIIVLIYSKILTIIVAVTVHHIKSKNKI